MTPLATNVIAIPTRPGAVYNLIEKPNSSQSLFGALLSAQTIRQFTKRSGFDKSK